MQTLHELQVKIGDLTTRVSLVEALLAHMYDLILWNLNFISTLTDAEEHLSYMAQLEDFHSLKLRVHMEKRGFFTEEKLVSALSSTYPYVYGLATYQETTEEAKLCQTDQKRTNQE